MSLETKVALVTGSSSGIGLAIVHSLAERGVDVIATGLPEASAVGDIIDDLKRFGVNVNYVSADLSKLTDIEKLWSEVTQLYPGGIDILINNAGLHHMDLVENYPDDKWNLLIAVMLSAPFHLTKRCLPAMKRKGWGRIVNTSSMFGLTSNSTAAVYSAAKTGLIGLTKGVALENAAHGITCNAICPAFVHTALVEGGIEIIASKTGMSRQEIMQERIIDKLPTKEFIKTEQVAELVEFLCLSNASSQMTGATYLIDGGYTAQ